MDPFVLDHPAQTAGFDVRSSVGEALAKAIFNEQNV